MTLSSQNTVSKFIALQKKQKTLTRIQSKKFYISSVKGRHIWKFLKNRSKNRRKYGSIKLKSLRRPKRKLKNSKKILISLLSQKTATIKRFKNTGPRVILWDKDLPAYYSNLPLYDTLVCHSAYNYYLIFGRSIIRVDRNKYGSIILSGNLLKPRPNYEITKSLCFYNSTAISDKNFTEKQIAKFYHSIQPIAIANKMPRVKKLPFKRNKKCRSDYRQITVKNIGLEKRGYIKHIIRFRYRWFFRPSLHKFKLFKKFFKRSLKRYRKISKNKLFLRKFRSHFPKLTGLTEKGLLGLWSPFKRNYNQYWLASNAVKRFSQSLLLLPSNFLIFLKVSPSLAASQYIVKSGGITINGSTASLLKPFVPGDIMQFNTSIWRLVRKFFDFQRWDYIDIYAMEYLPFIQADWSCSMFMMLYWPEGYQLKAPSFMSERWIRYFIRQFPVRAARFKKAHTNWNVYRTIITKR